MFILWKTFQDKRKYEESWTENPYESDNQESENQEYENKEYENKESDFLDGWLKLRD